jgi:hypothetical protein
LAAYVTRLRRPKAGVSPIGVIVVKVSTDC